VRRSLVLALLLLGGGGLVWWNGARRSATTAAGALIGVGLWALIQLVPGLPELLQLAPLNPGQLGLVLGCCAAFLITLSLLDPDQGGAEERLG
jgi:Ca2+-transporting ATPase